MKIAFWRKETGNLMSHGKGLTKEDLEALAALKEGDRLIAWFNNPQDDSRPTFTLKTYRKDAKPANEF